MVSIREIFNKAATYLTESGKWMLGPAFAGGLLALSFSPDTALAVFSIPAVSYGAGKMLEIGGKAFPPIKPQNSRPN